MATFWRQRPRKRSWLIFLNWAALLANFGILATSEKSKVKNEAGILPNLELHLDDDYAIAHSDTPTLLASTLDGSLVAINQKSGEILWELDDEPVVKSPYDSSKPVLPAFLPDPKDGSIYMIGRGLKEPLKKLPFTIPELVAASPCKSSDGILYTGKKVDTWFAVDRFTGSKMGTITFQGCGPDENSCPNLGPASFLVGRTEYNIMMYDSRAEGRKWNISYFDYSSNLASSHAQHDFNSAFFTDSSRGDLVSLDRKTGTIDWKLEIGSPIVALFRVEGDGIVHNPFTSVSKETLTNLLEHFDSTESQKDLKGETKLFATLYVGEHEHGLYAMPSLVDEQTLTISPASNGPLLLEGPQNFEMPQNSEISLSGITDTKGHTNDPFGIPIDSDLGSNSKRSVLLFGYYQVPQHSTIKLSPAMTPLQLTSTSSHSGVSLKLDGRILPPFFPDLYPTKGLTDVPLIGHDYPTSVRNETPTSLGYDEEVITSGLNALRAFNLTFVASKEFLGFAKEAIKMTNVVIGRIENKELKVIAVLLFIGVAVLYRIMQKNSVFNGAYSTIRMSSSSIGSNGSQLAAMEVTALPVELENGHIKVGNIIFDPSHILGKGCEGTFVYKGKFDSRDVAVKRVLAACFTIADREVELLRESDEHPYVIRYFCMEQDRQFRYIALEYCCATLHDYVTGKYPCKLDNITILRQATEGLAHLHILDIVHRDIKPHNVLISMPGKKGEVRAMISDFGLCKKLKVGRMSFSRRSGIAGTEGWIAPEMMLGNRSTTCAVDIFSLGCVYYFVLSEGLHPFGESFKRQANILTHDFSLTSIGNNYEAINLIEKMIGHEPSLRPPASAVLKHPLFWTNAKKMYFLQDVSDRVDKEDVDSVILASLERNRLDVVRGNWLEVLDEHVHDDLKKHRTYRGGYVRDLLRALRNKKHHYNELSEVTKMMYGSIPDGFINYWTSRFPKLLIHSWMSMHCIKNESGFRPYFDRHYDFVKPASEAAGVDMTFHREPIAEPLLKRAHQDLFMPKFANKSHIEDEEEKKSSVVVSQWEKLAINEQETSEEHFVEMVDDIAAKKSISPQHQPVVRKVVGQLKSEAQKPETWAKAVTGPDKNTFVLSNCDKENLQPCEKNSDDTEEKADEEKLVWILPPEDDNKSRKRKKGKKK